MYILTNFYHIIEIISLYLSSTTSAFISSFTIGIIYDESTPKKALPDHLVTTRPSIVHP